MDESFQVELPPYSQDLADSGKKVSDGWGFIGSFNTEMATGGNMEGGDPLEAGASQNNFDFLHAINWKKAEELIAAGNFEERNGMRIIPLDVAAAEGVLYLIPEPKSPHGIDVDPSGRYLVVGGKLDPHVTIYDFEKVKAAAEAGDFEGEDAFGVPILNFDSVMAGQVEVGAGPLHTQFDSQGHGYTSMFLANAHRQVHAGRGRCEDGRRAVHAHRDDRHATTTSVTSRSPRATPSAPDDNYMVALNKWSIDRYLTVGPLHPQNFQLIDLKGGLGPMELIADMPIPDRASRTTPRSSRRTSCIAIDLYEPGTDVLTMAAQRVRHRSRRREGGAQR